MDIEIGCESFEADSYYGGKHITLNLHKIDFGGNSTEDYHKFIKEWIGPDSIAKVIDASDITESYDSYDLLSNIGDSEIIEYVKEYISGIDITELVDESVLEAYAKKYIRDKKIEGLI